MPVLATKMESQHKILISELTPAHVTCRSVQKVWQFRFDPSIFGEYTIVENEKRYSTQSYLINLAESEGFFNYMINFYSAICEQDLIWVYFSSEKDYFNFRQPEDPEAPIAAYHTGVNLLYVVKSKTDNVLVVERENVGIPVEIPPIITIEQPC